MTEFCPTCSCRLIPDRVGVPHCPDGCASREWDLDDGPDLVATMDEVTQRQPEREETRP